MQRERKPFISKSCTPESRRFSKGMEGLHPCGNGMEQDYGTARLSLSVLQKRALKPNGITLDGGPPLQSGTLLWSASKGLAGQVLLE